MAEGIPIFLFRTGMPACRIRDADRPTISPDLTGHLNVLEGREYVVTIAGKVLAKGGKNVS
jgi:hypothetical protein